MGLALIQVLYKTWWVKKRMQLVMDIFEIEVYKLRCERFGGQATLCSLWQIYTISSRNAVRDRIVRDSLYPMRRLAIGTGLFSSQAVLA